MLIIASMPEIWVIPCPYKLMDFIMRDPAPFQKTQEDPPGLRSRVCSSLQPHK